MHLIIIESYLAARNTTWSHQSHCTTLLAPDSAFQPAHKASLLSGELPRKLLLLNFLDLLFIERAGGIPCDSEQSYQGSQNRSSECALGLGSPSEDVCLWEGSKSV